VRLEILGKLKNLVTSLGIEQNTIVLLYVDDHTSGRSKFIFPWNYLWDSVEERMGDVIFQNQLKGKM
jgi:hypothetical protein